MPKTKLSKDGEYLVYRCPGCNDWHDVPAKRWNWNGDLERPTLSPSVRHRIQHEDGRYETVCHYHLVNGQIKYCNDCPHELKGKTVDLPEVGNPWPHSEPVTLDEGS